MLKLCMPRACAPSGGGHVLLSLLREDLSLPSAFSTVSAERGQSVSLVLVTGPSGMHLSKTHAWGLGSAGTKDGGESLPSGP